MYLMFIIDQKHSKAMGPAVLDSDMKMPPDSLTSVDIERGYFYSLERVRGTEVVLLGCPVLPTKSTKHF